MKTLIVGTLLLALASTLGVVAAEKQNPPAETAKKQTVCPVMGGAINTNFYADVSGQRVYFCCGGCSSKFKQDPEKYLAKMKKDGVVPEKVPAKKSPPD